MSPRGIALILGMRNPWSYTENLAAYAAAEKIHEKNKENIAGLILLAAVFSTGLSLPILYTYITYRVSFIPLFMTLTSFVIIPVVGFFTKSEFKIMLLTLLSVVSFTYTVANYIDFTISINPMIAFTLLVCYTHFWKFMLNDLDKKLYPPTDAEMKRRHMEMLMNEFRMRK
jgi:hypothetical protein